MPINRSVPNYYSAVAPRAASSTGVTALDFGFPALVVRVYNPSAADCYFNPASTGVCTTADVCVRACSELALQNVLISGLTLWATSTGATAQPITVSALG